MAVVYIEKNILLKAQHLPAVDNTIAENKSTVTQDRSNWMLCLKSFHQINQRLGGPVCQQADKSATELCLLEARPNGNGNRCH